MFLILIKVTIIEQKYLYRSKRVSCKLINETFHSKESTHAQALLPKTTQTF